MFGVGRIVRCFLIATGLVAGCAGLFQSLPGPSHYSKLLTLGPGIEWRFNSLVVDLDRDGHLDLVASARPVKDSPLFLCGSGEVPFSSTEPKRNSHGSR